MSDINKAITIAVFGHEGQKDEKGFPYIYHPLHVMNSMPIDDEEGRIVAILHDVIEDTRYDAEDLANYGFSADIVSALIAISKDSGEPYDDYLERVKGNYLASRVKLKDISHNYDRSVDELYEAQRYGDKAGIEKANRRVKKYRKAGGFLEASS